MSNHNDYAAKNAELANSMSKEQIKELNGMCHYCMAGDVGDCLCTKGYGAWYGNPNPATRTLKQVRINGQLQWVPRDWEPPVVAGRDPAELPKRSWWQKLFGHD